MLGLLVCAGIGASVAAAAYDGSATGIIATASSAAPTATATPTVTPPTPTVTGRRRRGQSSFPMFSMTVGSEISVNACGPDGCAHWVEATSWEGASYPSLFLGTDFDLATGRFNVRRTGLYFASSMLRIDGASSGWYSTAILTNGVQSWDSGMSALNGALSSNYHDFTMAGTRWLDEGDFLSVWAYAHNDASFVLQQNSAGFHAYLISEQPSTVAFSATKDGAQHVVAGDANSCGWDPTAVPGCGWAEVTGGSAWKVDGYKGLLANDAFDLGTGRFTAPRAGIYLACTTIRLDSADEGWFSTAILTNGADSFDGSFDSGMSVLSGGLSENYNDMTISGLRQLESGDFLSVAVYSAFDTDYTMYSNSAGFSAASIRSKVAFSAAKVETQDVTTAGWTESSGPYSCTGYKGLFPHARFDETTGRFTAPSAGIYFTSANIRLDHADTGWFSAAVLTNGEPSWESGMSALNGNLAANFEDMCVVGLRLLQADDFVSVWVYSNEDVEYSIAHDGGSLHVAQLRRMRDGDDVPAESFSVTVADASGNSGDSGTLGSTGWTEMSSWESESYKGLAHDFDFDTSTGRFTAQHSGIYYVAAQVRLDGADAGWFSVAILTNSEPSWESGLSALTGDAADNYHDISVVGLRDLAAQEYVSVWVYASQDTMYTLYSNSAGFHGCLLNTNVGFSATKGGDLSVDHTEWQEVVAAADDFAWSTSDYPSLFEISLPNTAASLDLSTGRFTVPEDGIYFASAMVRLDHADEGWFTAAVFTNGVASWHSGMSVAGEPADDYSDMTVSGFRQLQANDFLSVWVYSQIDESYLIQANSGGFSACVIDTGVAFSAARNENIHVQANGWTEMTGGGYTTDGYKGLFKLDNSFEEATGRFTAPSAGIYLASANIRLDNADEGWFSAAILTNGEASWESGMSVLNGDLADLYDNLAVSGLRQLDRGDWLSLWAYSNTDSDFDSDWAGFHVALVSDGLSTAGGTTDSDVVSGARIWQETWGVPTGHDGNDAGYNHLGSDAWGVCGQTRADRIQCCADECVRLGDACAAFAIWAPTSTDPPCCCHYISAADAATPIVANPTAQGPGDGWATWMPVQSHLHDTLHDLTTIEECTMETFTERADQMNAACCADGNACGDMGMPDRCTLDCATAFVPFMEECRPLIVALVADELPAFEGLKTSCLAIDPSTMWSAVTNLDAQGCLLREHAAPPLPPSTGGGHRRTQGLNFHHDLGNENCPMDSFNQRVQSIDVACCTQDGRDVCAADGVPTSCNLPCAVKFRIFYADCQSLVTTLLGDEVGEFESLSAQCTQQDPREMIYSLARPEGCVDAASCAQMGITDTSDVSMFYNGRGFTTHCLAAADVGTTGAAFTRFWHYDGRLSGGFPAGAEDVLGEAYGSCEDLNACFQRLPTFVPEQGAEFLVTDGTSTMLFDFDDSCDVAHAAFQAFHDGVEARIVGGACNWTPKAIQGSAPPTDGDSFFYGDSWGVKSLLLDDDGCYCASLLEAGKISCWSAGQAQNTWGDSPQGATIPAGVDFIAPADGCSYVDPAAGPLSFYFREPATSSGDGGYDACDPDSVTQIVVSGAGAAEWDGVYLRAANVGDGAAFQKDATHEIYSSGGVWRLADYGVATFYEAGFDGPAGNAMPPSDGFTVTGGAEPPPQLDLGRGC